MITRLAIVPTRSLWASTATAWARWAASSLCSTRLVGSGQHLQRPRRPLGIEDRARRPATRRALRSGADIDTTRQPDGVDLRRRRHDCGGPRRPNRGDGSAGGARQLLRFHALCAHVVRDACTRTPLKLLCPSHRRGPLLGCRRWRQIHHHRRLRRALLASLRRSGRGQKRALIM